MEESRQSCVGLSSRRRAGLADEAGQGGAAAGERRERPRLERGPRTKKGCLAMRWPIHARVVCCLGANERAKRAATCRSQKETGQAA